MRGINGGKFKKKLSEVNTRAVSRGHECVIHTSVLSFSTWSIVHICWFWISKKSIDHY